jgi:hypothetical protein
MSTQISGQDQHSVLRAKVISVPQCTDTTVARPEQGVPRLLFLSLACAELLGAANVHKPGIAVTQGPVAPVQLLAAS